MAFYEINPFGEERADLGWAIVASVIANVNRRRGSRRFRPRDFMPKFGRTRQQNLGQIVGVLQQVATVHNAKLGLLPSGEPMKAMPPGGQR